jgi:patatin-like phospholipase/acyl hydrolase
MGAAGAAAGTVRDALERGLHMSDPESGTPERFQILSLDGGGLKGLFSAAVLAALEEDLDCAVADHFDLIVGTSTGGLVALALGAGRRPSEIVNFYLDKGPAIFGQKRNVLARLFRPAHRSDRLKSELIEILGDRTLGSSDVPLVIPAYSLDAQDVYVFKTRHHERLNRDWRDRMVDVAMATTAAPTYLPPHRLGNHRLVDGGLWANNPTLVGVVEAVSMFEVPLSSIHVLSLGTTDDCTHLPTGLDNGGIISWARHAGPAALLRAQSLGTFHSAEHLITPERVVRVSAVVPEGLFGLDRVDSAAIRGLAEDVSRRQSPRASSFMAHTPRQWLEPLR